MCMCMITDHFMEQHEITFVNGDAVLNVCNNHREEERH